MVCVTQSFKQMEDLSNKDEKAFNGYVLGLAVPKFRVGSSYESDLRMEGDQVCVEAIHYTVDLDLERLDVYLAWETRRSRCVRKFVRGHEFRHVRDYKICLKESKALAQTLFGRLESKIPGVCADDPQELKKAISQVSHQTAQRISDFFAKRSDARGKSLDRREKGLVVKKCGASEMRKVIKK
jgi:hypothetical protein